MLGWISYVLVVGIKYILAISVGVLVLIQWLSSSISNKQYTTQSVAAKVAQQYYVICMVLRCVGIHNIQQNILIVEVLSYLLQRFSLWKRRDMDNTQQYTTTHKQYNNCLLYTSPSPRDGLLSRMPSSA